MLENFKPVLCLGAKSNTPVVLMAGASHVKQFVEIISSLEKRMKAAPMMSCRQGLEAVKLNQLLLGRGECGTDEVMDGKKKRNFENPTDDPAFEHEKATWLPWFFGKMAMAADLNVDARIADCKIIPASSVKTKNGSWDLVSRAYDSKSSRFYEVWRDSTIDPKTKKMNGLLWGERLGKSFTQLGSIQYGTKGKVLAETACDSYEGKKTAAGVKERKFGLPSEPELLTAYNHGIFELMPNWEEKTLHILQPQFWTTTVPPAFTAFASAIYADGESHFDSRDSEHFVHCVGR